MRHIIGIITFPVLLLVACADEHQKEYLMKVEELSTSVETLEKEIITIQKDREENKTDQEIIEIVQSTLQSIKENYNSDTIELDLAKKLDAYQEIEEALSVNSGNFAKTKQAINEIKESLNNLHHDIEKGVNDRASYQRFIDFETEKIDNIQKILAYYKEQADSYISKFEELHPEIENFNENLGGTDE